MSDERKVCFVVMGFGKKTDYESGRTLDLDATFDAIIRPAVDAAGLRCIRADQIMHSGLIDLPMYDMLLRADLVIADISTGNVNAVYELGVRHALRPRSTIIMKESAGKLSFDLNHVSTLHYEHLGPDIGNREARRASAALQNLITQVMAEQKADSPVYTFLPKLRQPSLSDEEYEERLVEAETLQCQLSSRINEGDLAMRSSRPADAAKAFAAARKLKPDDPTLIQKLALATYKSKMPSETAALFEAKEIIGALDPEHSNDPETLGLAGAIQKNLWKLHRNRAHLDAAVRFYGRGFELMRDYYNGENLALCYDLRAEVQTDGAEATYDRMSAQKVRKAVIELLLELMARPSFADRKDRRWIHATMANCYFALGMMNDGETQERAFMEQNASDWEIDSYKTGKQTAMQAKA
ncbi:DUF4071 domain-containing protein [Massilia sp. IC2-477]|uniref:DUF4071 domain-containing protein n=1 Tax=Massilia sp. IC2-477 TaxID=2887198 RepID=UPI001D12BA01|nr:DUF4071 domain-containing protein [Massilia sp. IC2-477]MCC2957415.1 DUF4071 domain-containing protein [Massilia sp. IC2-477]